MSAQGSLVRRRGWVLLMLTVLDVETRRLEARGGRGAVWAAATTSLRNWDREKWGRGERNSLFAVGMRGGARWNVAVRDGVTRGMFCANIVTLFLLWGLWER